MAKIAICRLLFASFLVTLSHGTDVTPKSFTPVFHPITKLALCSTDSPSAVLSLADVSFFVGLPPGVPETVACSYSCTGHSGCTSFNYRLQQSAPARCELYTYSLKNCTTSTNDTCFHYQMSELPPYSCRQSGGWSDWTAATNCTTVGQKTYTAVRYCNSPSPSDAASACVNSTGKSALIEYKSIACGTCDPNCYSLCEDNGYLTCDGSCRANYGINKTTFTCIACNTPHCIDSCNDYGPGTCDELCELGYLFNQTSHSCIAFPYNIVGCYGECYDRQDLSIVGWYEEDMTLEICAQSCYNKGYKFAGVRDGQFCHCGNTYGIYGPSTQCTTSCRGNSSQICGGSSENMVVSYCNYPCSPSCDSSSHKACDGNCTIGYGIDRATQTCAACNTPYCASSCNNYGPGTCDGPCVAGYTLHSTLHTCNALQYSTVGCYNGFTGSGISCSYMSLTFCALYCYNQSMQDSQIAAAYSGSYCYCGIYSGSPTSRTSDCDIRCPGNSQQVCGGRYAFTVLNTTMLSGGDVG